MSCPTCRRKRCIWIALKEDPEKLESVYLKTIIQHNIGFIDMICRDGSVSAITEERYYDRLLPYSEELEKRGEKES